jgi:hypothetical protein
MCDAARASPEEFYIWTLGVGLAERRVLQTPLAASPTAPAPPGNQITIA